MGADRPDEFDMPSADLGDRSPDLGRSGCFDRDADSGGRVDVDAELESRDRDSYYEQLQRAAWDEAAEHFKKEWAEHRERWPAEARERVDRSEDPEGSWRGDSGRFLDRAANAEIEERYQRIAETERDIVSPAMREIEACDPDRHLVGFDHRLKGPDRIKDKVAETTADQPGLTTGEALADVSDTIRFTFRYDEKRYTVSVHEDIERLKDCGFELVRLKNFWSADQYKGINAQWMIRETGQRFEVQFHTRISFEAKQLTHGAYERLRSRCLDEREEGELANMQREVSRSIPMLSNASNIKDHPERRENAG
jgi:hypothetical protein